MAIKLLELGANVATISLIEPVATGEHPTFMMLPQFLRANRLFKAYLNQNHEAYRKADAFVGDGETGGLRALPKFIGSSALYALALRGESLNPLFDPKIAELVRQNGTQLHISFVTGSDSEFKNIERRAQKAANKATDAGWDVSAEVVEQGTHAITVNATSFIKSACNAIRAQRRILPAATDKATSNEK